MRDRLIWLFGLLGLMACSSGSDPVTPAITPTLQVPGPPIAVSMSAAERSGEVNSAAPPGATLPVQSVEFGLEFIDNNQVARVSVDGVPTFLVFDGFSQFDNTSGSEVLAFSEGIVNGVFAGVDVVGMTYRDAEQVLPHVFGNISPTGTLPITGTADYSGYGIVWTDALSTATAAVDLTANFQSGQITGNIREALFGAPDVDLALESTPIIDGAFAGELSIDSANGSLDHGSMTGQFFGENGRHIAGTVLVVSPVGTSSGYYITDRVQQ